MKKKIFLIFSVLIVVLLVIFVSVSKYHHVEIDFNTKLKLTTNNNAIITSIKASNSNYSISNVEEYEVDAKTEKKVLKLARDITNAFNDIESNHYIENVEKYTLRIPASPIGKSNYDSQ